MVENFAEQHQFLHRGNEAQKVANHPVLEDRVVDALELQNHHRVLAQRLLGPHIDSPQILFEQGHIGPGFRPAEQLRDSFFGVHFADQRALAILSAQQRQCGGDGCLAGASFAGDHHESLGLKLSNHESPQAAH